MDKISGFLLRHRGLVGLAWLVITIVGVVVAPSLSSRLQPGTHLNTAAYNANVQIAKQYGGVTENPGVLVLNLPAGQTVASPQAAAELKAVDAALAKSAPDMRTVSYATTGSQALVGTGGTSTIVLAYPPHAGDDVSTAVVDQLTAAAKTAAPG